MIAAMGMPPTGSAPGRRKIAVKVVDIFGNDTMTIVDVSVGKNGGKNNGAIISVTSPK